MESLQNTQMKESFNIIFLNALLVAVFVNDNTARLSNLSFLT